MTSSLKNLAVKGTAWTILGYGGSQLLRFGGNIILTRLLVPEYFGLMAIVNAIRMGLELFSDIGIAQNVIRSKRGDDPDFLNTAWSISILRGFALWIALLLLAWPIARFYQEPTLFQILLVVSIATPINGAVSTKLYTLNRHMKLGKLTLIEFLSQTLGLVTMIAIAFFYPSIWSLVIGILVGQIFRTVVSYVALPGHHHQFIIESKAKQEIIAFGRWLFLSSIVVFLSEQSDRLILGKLVPLEILGVYTVAYTFAGIPQQIMKKMSFKVIFPLISKRIDLPRRQLRQKLNHQWWKLHSILLSILVVLGGFGDIIIRFLYDSRYDQAAWMMPILALGGWFSALFFMADSCVLALGKSFYSAQSRIFRLLAVTFGLVIGFRMGGILGAIIVIALGDVPAYLAIQYRMHKEGLGCFWQDIRSTLVFVLLLGIVFLIRSYLGLGLPFDFLSSPS